MSYSFSFCEASDDAEILRILESNPIGHSPKLAYTARPSYFRALRSLYEQFFILGMKTDTGDLAGVGTIGVQQRFIDGKARAVGYMEHLRVDHPHRGKGLLGRGFAYLKEHRDDIPVDFFLSSVISDNKRALEILTRKRKNWPRFHHLCDVETKLLISASRKREYTTRVCVSRNQEAIDFINRIGSRKEFFPVLTKQIKGKVITAHNGSRLVGACVVWDQRDIKQMKVVSWGFPLRFVVCALNTILKVRNRQPLPIEGTLPFAFISFVAIEDDNPDVFEDILTYVEQHFAAKYTFFAIGLDARDPLVEVLQRRRCVTYKSKLFYVSWGKPPRVVERLRKNLMYPEVATL